MAWVFDTDAVSEMVRRQPLPLFASWLASVQVSELAMPAVVRAELLTGVRRRGDVGGRSMERRYREDVFPLFRTIPFAVEAADAYAVMRSGLETAGEPLADMDLLVAATTVADAGTLVTGNIRHFQRLQAHGLQVFPILAQARAARG